MSHFKKFTDWKKKLLAGRGLEAPDARALYQYKLTTDEYSELEELLHKWLHLITQQVSFKLSDVPRVSGFSALFVLYAAEWWRRRYDGAGFTWDPILRDLGVEPRDWTATQRSDCVRIGLRDWGLKPRETGALRYLGTVALQGGLPVRLLAKAQGGLGQVLKRVLLMARNGAVPREQLTQWIEELCQLLPKSYRQREIYSLLADVAWIALDLKAQAGLTDGSSAVAKLDASVPNWRDRFPLSLEDQAAQGLIEQVVQDAASVRSESTRRVFPVSRFLEPVLDSSRGSADRSGGNPQDSTHQSGSQAYRLRSSLALPETVDAKHLTALFQIDAEDLPRQAELILRVGDRALGTSLRRIHGRTIYRLGDRPMGIEGALAAEEHILELASPDGRRWRVPAPRGEALAEDLPWVFGAETGGPRLLRQGGGPVPIAQLLVALPVQWVDATAPAPKSPDIVGALDSSERILVAVQAPAPVVDPHGNRFQIRCGGRSGTEDTFSWQGKRLWLDFLSPRQAFLGRPTLTRTDENGHVQRLDGELDWVVDHTRRGGTPIGSLVARYVVAGDVHFRDRLLVLPAQARLCLEPEGPNGGQVRFEQWGASHAMLVGGNTDGQLDCQTHRQGNDLILTLRVGSDAKAPETVTVQLFWPDDTQTARLRLPFPAQGVRAFDRRGGEIPSGALLTVSQLLGTRLWVIRAETHQPVELEFAPRWGKALQCYDMRTVPGVQTLEIRLQDFLSDIQQMLCLDDQTDSSVRVTVRVGGREQFRGKIARYAAVLQREETGVRLEYPEMTSVDPDATGSVKMLALRMEYPGDEPEALQEITNEGVPTGVWSFDPNRREPGAWLLYPAPGTSVAFRPTLWTVRPDTDGISVEGSSTEPLVTRPDPSEGASAIPEQPWMLESFDSGRSEVSRAVAVGGEHARLEAIDWAISRMAADYQDPSWVDVEQLANHLGHLPLSTLDLWRRLARSTDGMAALFLRLANLPADFSHRFAEELPFSWETVPLESWRRAMACMKEQYQTIYGLPLADTLFRSQLERRIEELRDRHNACYFLLGFASAVHLPAAEKEAQLLSYIGSNAKAKLFDEEDSDFMKLRRRQADDRWPTGLNSWVKEAQKDPYLKRFSLAVDQEFLTGVANTPILLAVQVMRGDSGEWLKHPQRIGGLREVRSFDSGWFDDAFNLTVAWYLAVEAAAVTQ